MVIIGLLAKFICLNSKFLNFYFAIGLSPKGKGRPIFHTAPEEEKVFEYKLVGQMGPGRSFGEIA